MLFKEIAMFSKEALRTATIICRERVEVLVVNREVVLEYCPDVFQREYEEKLNVLRSAVKIFIFTLHTRKVQRQSFRFSLINRCQSLEVLIYFIHYKKRVPEGWHLLQGIVVEFLFNSRMFRNH